MDSKNHQKNLSSDIKQFEQELSHRVNKVFNQEEESKDDHKGVTLISIEDQSKTIT